MIQHMKQQSVATFGVCSDVPDSSQISLLLDLFEISGNIQGLVSFIGFFTAPREHSFMKVQSHSYLTTMKASKLRLVVSIIRKYNSCFLNAADLCAVMFRG